MNKVFQWVRNIVSSLRTPTTSIRYHKVTSDIYARVDRLYNSWEALCIYHRQDEVRILYNQLADYGDVLLHTVSDNNEGLEEECCYYFINELMQVFHDPFICYNDDFSDFHMICIEALHAFDPAIMLPEIEYQRYGKRVSSKSIFHKNITAH